MSSPLLQATGLTKRFGETLTAVNNVDLTVSENECLGIVGESGSGKSTLLRILNGLQQPDEGSVRFRDSELTGLSRSELRKPRREIQMIFQDPAASLNPRMRVGDLISEPLRIQHIPRSEWPKRVTDILEAVQLPRTALKRYPHEFSGGQRQRIGIARALVLRPALVLADEPVASLDVSIQAQILNLLMELRHTTGCAMVFVAHDLPVVQAISDRVVVMKEGERVEEAASTDLFQNAQHPYTQKLVAATATLDRASFRANPHRILAP